MPTHLHFHLSGTLMRFPVDKTLTFPAQILSSSQVCLETTGPVALTETLHPKQRGFHWTGVLLGVCSGSWLWPLGCFQSRPRYLEALKATR